MEISSTLLAMNWMYNLEETEKADFCAICIVEHECPVDFPVAELSEARGIQAVLPIYHDDSELAVLLVLDDVDEGVRKAERLLWESGLLLSSKLVLIKPELKVLKEFGEGL